MPMSNDAAQKCKSIELICSSCGSRYLFRAGEASLFKIRGWSNPIRCPKCRKEKRIAREQEEERVENVKWQQRKAADKVEFESRLNDWRVLDIQTISPSNNTVLYIIGNGFDLMHGVKSSYYAFRDSLGKHSNLREQLELCLTPEDIWADFEGSLAKINVSLMSDKDIVDMWLDDFEAYDEDAGAAEYYLAIDAALSPIAALSESLQKRFRSWVEGLSVGTEDRPLTNLFKNGKTLCFNYTELVEMLYGVSRENVCYIHGNRRKGKHGRKERLILGHQPGASDEAFEDYQYSPQKSNTYKKAMIALAQENIIEQIGFYDNDLTKNTDEIIAAHQQFFMSLGNTEEVIVIGHSYSEVDWPYFEEIVLRLSAGNPVLWKFGCHGLHDLSNLEKLLEHLGLKKTGVIVFRTDTITVKLKAIDLTQQSTKATNTRRKDLCSSADGRWKAVASDNRLEIINTNTESLVYDTIISSPLNRAFFDESSQSLIVIIKGIDDGILLFRFEDGHWLFKNELESIQNQSIVNRRLSGVFLFDGKLMFVYNNRVREYDLSNGELVANVAKRRATNDTYCGENIISKFI